MPQVQPANELVKKLNQAADRAQQVNAATAAASAALVPSPVAPAAPGAPTQGSTSGRTVPSG